ncbi:ABC transporter permease [Plantactinospora alkalitolerans]|nr:ABC transporter permease [Plantactinospora alkalitolerans]
MSELAASGTVGAPPARSGPTDLATMIGRCLRLSARNVEALIMSLMLPIMLMLLFVYLFGGAIDTGTSYVSYVVPGVILLCAGFGSATTAVAVHQDMTGGIADRFRSMDISGASVLGGQVAASVARNLVSTVLVFGVAFLIGFRPHAGLVDWLAAGGILLAFILAMSWLAAVVGLLARSVEAANGFTFFMTFLPYPSSAFVPIDSMPAWSRGIAEHQPVNPVIESLRGLLLDTPVGNSPWIALTWCAGLLAVSVTLAVVLFRRRTG